MVGSKTIPSAGATPFAQLSAEEQAAIREKQQSRKAKRKARASADSVAVDVDGDADAEGISGGKHEGPLPARDAGSISAARTAAAAEYPSQITQRHYFAACGGLFRDPSFGPTMENLQLLMAALGQEDEQARRLGACNYFQFPGDAKAVWNPQFNAKLAYEGFFTITTTRRGVTEPLPELQPFYSVLTWPNFERSKHVRKALGRLRRSDRLYRLENNRDPGRTWRHLDAYHRNNYGSNWLTKQYFQMLQAASADPSINFKLQCVELYADAAGDDVPAAHAPESSGVDSVAPPSSAGTGPTPLAGEIGFSIGGVYTSLSGWTEARTCEGLGTFQLVLLCRWLQLKGFAFWSLGHCYSPEMNYKYQLGHRVYPRADFLALLKQHRGTFTATDTSPLHAFCDGEACTAAALLEVANT